MPKSVRANNATACWCAFAAPSHAHSHAACALQLTHRVHACLQARAASLWTLTLRRQQQQHPPAPPSRQAALRPSPQPRPSRHSPLAADYAQHRLIQGDVLVSHACAEVAAAALGAPARGHVSANCGCFSSNPHRPTFTISTQCTARTSTPAYSTTPVLWANMQAHTDAPRLHACSSHTELRYCAARCAHGAAEATKRTMKQNETMRGCRAHVAAPPPQAKTKLSSEGIAALNTAACTTCPVLQSKACASSFPSPACAY